MEENKKAKKLGVLIGEENAKLLLDTITEESQALGDRLAGIVSEYSGGMRKKMQGLLNGCGTWSDDQNDEVMDLLRTETIDSTACEVLVLAGTLQSSAPVEMSRYASHALTHYEAGLLQARQLDIEKSVGSLLNALRRPAASSDETPSDTAPPTPSPA